MGDIHVYSGSNSRWTFHHLLLPLGQKQQVQQQSHPQTNIPGRDWGGSNPPQSPRTSTNKYPPRKGDFTYPARLHQHSQTNILGGRGTLEATQTSTNQILWRRTGRVIKTLYQNHNQFLGWSGQQYILWRPHLTVYCGVFRDRTQEGDKSRGLVPNTRRTDPTNTCTDTYHPATQPSPPPSIIPFICTQYTHQPSTWAVYTVG